LSALRVGTRGSALALAQAGWVAQRLAEPAELVVITTDGDRDHAAGDKSRWTGALEAALQSGEIDLAVHSAKDVPQDLGDGLVLVAAPPRASSADVLVGAASLDALPVGARVGTSALRRRAQLLAVRPDLELIELRGNVDTRLRKLAGGEADALVLARAGLERLGLDPEGSELDGELFVPAPGQGVLAVQAREDDQRARAATAELDDPATSACLSAERAAARALGASCHTAVGIHADGETIRGFAGLPDGSVWILDEVPGADGDALAARMLAAGAAELLA
jgi:hydroxymethylbilane synthase